MNAFEYPKEINLKKKLSFHIPHSPGMKQMST